MRNSLDFSFLEPISEEVTKEEIERLSIENKVLADIRFLKNQDYSFLNSKFDYKGSNTLLKKIYKTENKTLNNILSNTELRINSKQLTKANLLQIRKMLDHFLIKLKKYEAKKVAEYGILTNSRRKKDVDRLLEMLSAKYEFNGFYHYTSFENFIKIMKSGEVLSRQELINKNLEFYDSASHEVLDRTDSLPLKSVRMFYAPKTPFSYVTEGIKANNEKEHMPIPVALLFNKDIAYSDGFTFLDGSGGHLSEEVQYKSNCTTDPRVAEKYKWDLIFYRGPVPSYRYHISVHGETDRGKIINYKNAEVLLPRKLNTNKIEKIFFRSVPDKLMAESLIGKDPRYVVAEEKKIFNEQHNYLRAWHATITDKSVVIILAYHLYNYSKYDHKVILYQGDKQYEYFINDYMRQLSDNLVRVGLNTENINTVDRLEYYMNNHLSAIWIKEK